MSTSVPYEIMIPTSQSGEAEDREVGERVIGERWVEEV
jgi:hypothetical protein